MTSNITDFIAPPKTRSDITFVAFNHENSAHTTSLVKLLKQQAETHGAHFTEERTSDLLLTLHSGRIHAIFCKLTQPNPHGSGQFIGLMTYTKAITEVGSTLYLEDIVIDKKLRNQKIGTSALFYLAQIAATSNRHGVKWYVRRDNVPAQRMYDKFSKVDYQTKPPIMVFHDSLQLLQITAPRDGEGTTRRAQHEDAANITTFLKQQNEFSWDDETNIVVKEAIKGNQRLDGPDADNFCYISLDRETNAINGAMVCSRGSSTFRLVNTTHMHLLAFNNPETLRQDLPAMLRCAANEQEMRGWGRTLYIDTGYIQPEETRSALTDVLFRLGAKVLSYNNIPMVAGALSSKNSARFVATHIP